MVGGVRVDAPLDGARRHAQRLAPRSRLDRLEVPILNCAVAYKRFDLRDDLDLERRFEPPFLAASCEAASGASSERMRYAAFRAAGLCTSTGVVEAGCKVAIGTRLKRTGMHWTVRGADAIIALRCCKLSGRFEDFWERRALKGAAT